MSNIIISLKKGNQTLTEKVEILQIKIRELENKNYELRKTNMELEKKLDYYKSKNTNNNTDSAIGRIIQEAFMYSNIIDKMEEK